MTKDLGLFLKALLDQGLLECADVLGAWVTQADAAWLILRFRQSQEIKCSVVHCPLGFDKVEEAAAELLVQLRAGRVPIASPQAAHWPAVGPWRYPPISEPQLFGFDADKLRFDVGHQKPEGMSQKDWEILYEYQGNTWAETILPRFIHQWVPGHREWEPLFGIWVSAPDAVTVMIGKDFQKQWVYEPEWPNGSGLRTWPGGRRWMVVLHTILASGNHVNPWDPTYLEQDLMLMDDINYHSIAQQASRPDDGLIVPGGPDYVSEGSIDLARRVVGVLDW